MPTKTKDVKVEVAVEQRDLELTTYKMNITVPTNDSIVMEWLASQGAIDSLSSHLTKAIIDYFHKSSSQVKQALASKPKQQKLPNKTSGRKKTKSDEKEKILGD